MAETKKLTCPNCGRELDIPAELDEFSCLYCGHRSQVAVVRAIRESDGLSYDAVRAELSEALPKMVTNYKDYYQKLDKKSFPAAFETYEKDNGETLDRLDVCARLHPQGMDAAMREICADMMDTLEKYMQADKRWAKKMKRSELIFEIKVVLAIFLTPLVRKRKLESSEAFRTQLNQQWMERLPKEKWTPGDYEVMMSGFKRRKFCFITTATCAAEGKPDDCAELTAFRAFRDGWLTEHGGEALIERYYEVAPSIVTCIDYCDDARKCYRELRERWLEPCYLALSEERYADCREMYVDMVQTLEKRYLQ